MIKRLVLGILRRIHNLFRPITRRIGNRLRNLMVDAVAPMQARIDALSVQTDQMLLEVRGDLAEHRPLAERIAALESDLLSRVESVDFKHVQLAGAVHALHGTVLRLAATVDELQPSIGRGKLTAGLATLDRNIEFIKARLSSYAGPDAVLTYLKDESPIFVNTGDLGCPSPIVDGGVWEQENTDVLTSFVSDATVFLDIGANVGYFSIVVGNRLNKARGRVLAFEPHPQMVNLIERSAQLNHLEPVLSVHSIAVSDKEGIVDLFYPDGHVGQGSSMRTFDTPGKTVHASAYPLDTYLPGDLQVDLVKIDVEGAEAAVLRGMEAIIRRSPRIRILFEKLATVSDSATDELTAFFEMLGFKLYGVAAGSVLEPLDTQQFRARIGDIVAAREGVIDHLARSRFSIYPGQLLGEGRHGSDATTYEAAANGILFFGPYWRLPAGHWRLEVHGTITGRISLMVGGVDPINAQVIELSGDVRGSDFFMAHDLQQFELRALAIEDASIALSRIDLVRL